VTDKKLLEEFLKENSGIIFANNWPDLWRMVSKKISSEGIRT
jgi:hypothetical protein